MNEKEKAKEKGLVIGCLKMRIWVVTPEIPLKQEVDKKKQVFRAKLV